MDKILIGAVFLLGVIVGALIQNYYTRRVLKALMKCTVPRIKRMRKEVGMKNRKDERIKPRIGWIILSVIWLFGIITYISIGYLYYGADAFILAIMGFLFFVSLYYLYNTLYTKCCFPIREVKK